MKKNFSHIGLAKLCGWFGITRQAYYKNRWQGATTVLQEEFVIREVKKIRTSHSRMGTRKLYKKLHPFIQEHQIKMGRDALFSLLSANDLLVKRRKRSIQTTQSFHWLRKYPNLIRELIPTTINQLWVADITYWKIEDSHLYLSFITDAYSHKIIGYNLHETLETAGCLQSLSMALSSLNAGKHEQLIHHSDRGIQYCSQVYVKLLGKHSIQISMTENGDPRENAIAERINGIIKEEYLNHLEFSSVKQARQILKKAIELYNNDRPHLSIGYLTPNQLHQSPQLTHKGKVWKNYFHRPKTLENQFQDLDSQCKPMPGQLT